MQQQTPPIDTVEDETPPGATAIPSRSFTYKEAAERMGITYYMVRKLIADGHLDRCVGMHKVSQEDIDAYFKKKEAA